MIPLLLSLSLHLPLPSYATVLPAHSQVTQSAQCNHGGYWQDMAAFVQRGRRLVQPRQRWDASYPGYRWPVAGRQTVLFDGITFYNQSSQPVIVAGWC